MDVGLIGCGSWGKNILRDLKILDCNVTVVCKSSQNQQYALNNGADKVLENVNDLTNLDGIIIATPTSTHATVIKQVAHFNIPIFVEKPLTNDVISAKEVVDLAGDRLFIMDKWRYHPGIEALATVATSQQLGSVQGLHSIRIGWGNPHPDVNMVWTLLPHDLSIALEIFGYVPEVKNAVTSSWDNELTGIVGILGNKPWVIAEISAASSIWRREVKLICDNGIAVLNDGYADHIKIYKKQSWNRGTIENDENNVAHEKIYFSNKTPLVEELRCFINYIKGGPAPKSTAADGLKVVEVISALCQTALS